MKYIRVNWHHNFPDEPVLLYSEIDEDRYEVRKVEVYRDGRCDFADAVSSTGTTMLGEIPTPALEEIREEGGFEPVEIGADEFEMMWKKACS